MLYLLFTHGYNADGEPAFAAEAISLARLLQELMPDQGEVSALLALFLFQHSRRAVHGAGPVPVGARRTGVAGELRVTVEAAVTVEAMRAEWGRCSFWNDVFFEGGGPKTRERMRFVRQG
ncbi:DUF6596 domain-containing protein [Streptosporangium sp. NPDC051023]|uniref:DUF6596 domain-containing protein n=1 Tax=Streptosporangium sp. NPDC051023 TaxID=3155410 RepID=UPI00344F385D